jgi:hypothetical protein
LLQNKESVASLKEAKEFFEGCVANTKNFNLKTAPDCLQEMVAKIVSLGSSTQQIDKLEMGPGKEFLKGRGGIDELRLEIIEEMESKYGEGGQGETDSKTIDNLEQSEDSTARTYPFITMDVYFKHWRKLRDATLPGLSGASLSELPRLVGLACSLGTEWEVIVA